MKKLILALMAALVLVGCGGGTPTQPGPNPTPQPPANQPAPVPAPPVPQPQSADAIVVYVQSRCDYFVVYTPKTASFAVFEYWRGIYPSVDDALLGKVSSFGFEDLFKVTRNGTMHVWIEDYLLSERRAADIILQKCR